jgi:RHS repeat-associated protein
LVKEDRGVMSVAKNSPESTTRVIFWYHPDYLGNVDLVTKRGGYAHEYFQYNPWGEEMHQWNANIFSFSSPYRFNSKELDQETGLHYYGARYYQSKLSLWMSVDPLAHETPEPYAFTGNNPVNKVDPDGRKADFWPWLKNLFNRTKPEQCSNFKVDRARRSKVQWRKNRNMIAFKKAAKAAGRFIYSQQQVVEDHWETVIDINLTYPDGPFDSLDPESKYRVIFEKEDKAMYWDDKWKMRTFSGPRTIQIPKGTIDWYGQYENSPDKPRLERRTYYQTKGVQIMGILVWLDKKNISRSFTNPKRRPKPKTVKGNRIRRNYRRNNN